MQKLKKNRLIIALRDEMKRLNKKNIPTLDHEQSIHFLKTGIVIRGQNRGDILDSCITDFETVYSDYCEY